MFDVMQVERGPQVVVDRSRDSELTRFGIETLKDRYLLPGEDPQDMFARVAMTYADDTDHAQRLYDYISRLWFMPATPVLSNGGAHRGLPISCFLNECSDSLDGVNYLASQVKFRWHLHYSSVRALASNSVATLLADRRRTTEVV